MSCLGTITVGFRSECQLDYSVLSPLTRHCKPIVLTDYAGLLNGYVADPISNLINGDRVLMSYGNLCFE
jgi:hypothetical protein